MKKLLFLMVVGFGGAMVVKGGYVTINPDNQIVVAGHQVPLPESVQNSPFLGVVMSMAHLPATPQPAAADARAGAVQPSRPALPSVTSVTATYNANAPRSGPANGSDQLSAAAKAIH
jgi:hypothetical protein